MRLQINHKSKILNSWFWHWFIRVSSFNSQVSREQGIALLLVVVLLSAMLSISFGIFAIIFGQILISGEIADSFIALLAADEGIERTLYLDRIQGPLAGEYTENATVASGGCYTVLVTKAGVNTTITISGQYRCGDNPARVVKRGFEVRY